MGRYGEFPDTGLEDRPVLRKSSPEVGELLTKILDAADKLEKRSRRMSEQQLYEIQQRLGTKINEVQKNIFESIAKARARRLAKAAEYPHTFLPGQQVLCKGDGDQWVRGTVRRHVSDTNVEVYFCNGPNDYGLYHVDELKEAQ